MRHFLREEACFKRNHFVATGTPQIESAAPDSYVKSLRATIYAAIRNPRGLPEPLGESCRFSLERWWLPKTFDLDQTLSFTRSWVRIGNRCLNRQPRDLLIQGMTCSSFCANSPTFAISLCNDSHVNCHCFDSYHWAYQSVTNFPTQNKTEHSRTNTSSILDCQPNSTNQPWFANQNAPLP